jgi:secreted trypsin-like serine protease
VDEGDPAVVAVNDLNVDCQRAGAPTCTGTLIAPDVVLTAGHCVGELPAESFGVLLGAQADLGPGELGAGLEGAFFQVAEIRLHPGFDPGSLANDVALLRLDGEAAAPPALMFEGPLEPSFVGATARVVGFGLAEEKPASVKRQGTVVVTEVSPLELVYGSGPSMTCSGDSGGPLFVTVDGVEYLAGVTSRGDTRCADYGVAIQVDTLPSDGFEGAW